MNRHEYKKLKPGEEIEIELDGLDAESRLTKMLRQEVQKQIRLEEKFNLPTLEERIERQEKMLEKNLPNVLEEGILRNLINLTAKKIKRDYCE